MMAVHPRLTMPGGEWSAAPGAAPLAAPQPRAHADGAVRLEAFRPSQGPRAPAARHGDQRGPSDLSGCQPARQPDAPRGEQSGAPIAAAQAAVCGA